MRLKQYLTESELQQYIYEKLIKIRGTEGDNYGNIIILAGGGGSGKGFARENFLEGDKYKVRDVDELKRLFVELEKLKRKYPELRDINWKNPKHVSRLHDFVTKKNIKNKTLDMLLTDVKKGQLPNVLFDITLANLKKAEFIKKLIDEVGYSPKDVNLVWVLTDYKVAVIQNRSPDRDRIVPEDVLLQTHEGAALSMISIIKGEAPLFSNKKYFDGEIYVILGGKNHTVFWTDENGEPIMTKVNPELRKKLGYSPEAKPRPIIKDFKYLRIKEKGKPVIRDAEVQKKLHQWIIDSIPRTLTTKTIWKETD